MFHFKSNENRKPLKTIIAHAKTIKTRYCYEFVKILDSLKRKSKNTKYNMSWLINMYILYQYISG